MRDASGTSSSTMRPTRTWVTPSNPRAGRALSTVCPCGSRLACVGRGRGVDGEGEAAELLEQLAVAEDLRGAVEVDVLVVPDVGLRRGGEDRLGQLLRFFETRRQLDAADGAGGAIVLPAG